MEFCFCTHDLKLEAPHVARRYFVGAAPSSPPAPLQGWRGGNCTAVHAAEGGCATTDNHPGSPRDGHQPSGTQLLIETDLLPIQVFLLLALPRPARRGVLELADRAVYGDATLVAIDHASAHYWRLVFDARGYFLAARSNSHD